MWNPGSSRRRPSPWPTRHALGECDETSESDISFGGNGSVAKVSSQALGWNSSPCATGVKPAETRRNAKPDDCAIPYEIHNHLSTT